MSQKKTEKNVSSVLNAWLPLLCQSNVQFEKISFIAMMFFSSLLFSYLLCSALLDPTPPYSIRLYPTRCPTCLSLPFLSSMLWPLVSPIHWIFFCWQLTFQTWSPGWLLFKTSLFFFKTFSCSSIYEWNEGWIPNCTSSFHTCSLWNSVLLVKCAVKSSFVILAAKIFVKV